MRSIVLWKMQSPERPGERVEFTGGEMVVGRSVACDLRIPLDLVSRMHIRIQYDEGERVWKVFDLHSRNGTLLNGERVDEAEVKPGDTITLGVGGPQVRIVALDPAPKVPPPAAVPGETGRMPAMREPSPSPSTLAETGMMPAMRGPPSSPSTLAETGMMPAMREPPSSPSTLAETGMMPAMREVPSSPTGRAGDEQLLPAAKPAAGGAAAHHREAGPDATTRPVDDAAETARSPTGHPLRFCAIILVGAVLGFLTGLQIWGGILPARAVNAPGLFLAVNLLKAQPGLPAGWLVPLFMAVHFGLAFALIQRPWRGWFWLAVLLALHAGAVVLVKADPDAVKGLLATSVEVRDRILSAITGKP